VEPISPEQIEDLRAGHVQRERKLAVCSGALHLPAADRAEILAIFAAGHDEMAAEHAQQALLVEPLESFLEALKRPNAAPALFLYCGKNMADKPGIGDAMLQNKACAAEHLVPIVRHLSALGIQSLLEELERISESPALASALEHSSSVTAEQKQLLYELRGTTMEEALLQDAVSVEPDPIKRQSLLQRVAKMNVSQRVQLALKGASEERRTLIRDSNKVVQRAVLQSPRLTDQEVEAFAAMSNLTDEVLRLIATNRNFRKNYVVVRNLLNNPKTPLDVSLHILMMLNAQDLKKLTMNKNVPETLRSTAVKLQRQRQELRPGS
jgi:hypothetical protein